MKFFRSTTIILGFVALSVYFTNAYFSDQVIISGNQITTGTWPKDMVVINEVYYDVAPNKGGDGNVSNSGEWVELYNAGNSSIDLKNWTITDNNTARTFNATSHALMPNHYALITKDHSIWSLYWLVPAGVEIIELGQVIGNGLSNSGDRLILKDSQGNIVDQISYGTDTSILNPAIIDVAEGHSIERNPAGYDTNMATDFTDRAIPTPGS